MAELADAVVLDTTSLRSISSTLIMPTKLIEFFPDGEIGKHVALKTPWLYALTVQVRLREPNLKV